MSYPTVSIGSQAYSVYADQEQADLYLDASITSAATNWRDSTTTDADTKARALVSATRWLDSVLWTGIKTDNSQELAWPRTNITDVDPATLPTQLAAACIELAVSLVDDNDGRADLKTPGIKTQRAGSVSLEYFRPESDTQVQTPFPAVVMALISQWLGGAGAPVGSISQGTCGTSKLLDEKYDFQHGI